MGLIVIQRNPDEESQKKTEKPRSLIDLDARPPQTSSTPPPIQQRSLIPRPRLPDEPQEIQKPTATSNVEAKSLIKIEPEVVSALNTLETERQLFLRLSRDAQLGHVVASHLSTNTLKAVVAVPFMPQTTVTSRPDDHKLLVDALFERIFQLRIDGMSRDKIRDWIWFHTNEPDYVPRYSGSIPRVTFILLGTSNAANDPRRTPAIVTPPRPGKHYEALAAKFRGDSICAFHGFHGKRFGFAILNGLFGPRNQPGQTETMVPAHDMDFLRLLSHWEEEMASVPLIKGNPPARHPVTLKEINLALLPGNHFDGTTVVGNLYKTLVRFDTHRERHPIPLLSRGELSETFGEEWLEYHKQQEPASMGLRSRNGHWFAYVGVVSEPLGKGKLSVHETDQELLRSIEKLINTRDSGTPGGDSAQKWGVITIDRGHFMADFGPWFRNANKENSYTGTTLMEEVLLFGKCQPNNDVAPAPHEDTTVEGKRAQARRHANRPAETCLLTNRFGETFAYFDMLEAPLIKGEKTLPEQRWEVVKRLVEFCNRHREFDIVESFVTAGKPGAVLDPATSAMCRKIFLRLKHRNWPTLAERRDGSRAPIADMTVLKMEQRNYAAKMKDWFRSSFGMEVDNSLSFPMLDLTHTGRKSARFLERNIRSWWGREDEEGNGIALINVPINLGAGRGAGADTTTPEANFDWIKAQLCWTEQFWWREIVRGQFLKRWGPHHKPETEVDTFDYVYAVEFKRRNAFKGLTLSQLTDHECSEDPWAKFLPPEFHRDFWKK